MDYVSFVWVPSEVAGLQISTCVQSWVICLTNKATNSTFVPHEWNWPKICCRVVRITENLFKSSSFLSPPSCVTWGLAGLLPEDDFAESVWLMEFSSCHINLNTVTKVVFNASAVVLWVVSSGKTLSVCAGVRVCVFLWAWNTLLYQTRISVASSFTAAWKCLFTPLEQTSNKLCNCSNSGKIITIRPYCKQYFAAISLNLFNWFKIRVA